jgi:hypothetical protein
LEAIRMRVCKKVFEAHLKFFPSVQPLVQRSAAPAYTLVACPRSPEFLKPKAAALETALSQSRLGSDDECVDMGVEISQEACSEYGNSFRDEINLEYECRDVNGVYHRLLIGRTDLSI